MHEPLAIPPNCPAPLRWHIVETNRLRAGAESELRIPAALGRVLDIGCGIGQAAAFITGAHLLVGVDLDYSALAYGKDIHPDIHFCCASAANLPFTDGSFDALVCRWALTYVHVPMALKEFRRVLRPGGILYLRIASWGFPASEMWRSIRHMELRGSLYYAFGLLNSIPVWFGRQWKYPFAPIAGLGPYFSAQQPIPTRSLLLASGFRRVTYRSPDSMVIEAEA